MTGVKSFEKDAHRCKGRLLVLKHLSEVEVTMWADQALCFSCNCVISYWLEFRVHHNEIATICLCSTLYSLLRTRNVRTEYSSISVWEARLHLVKYLGSGTRLPEFKSQLCHSCLCDWSHYLTSVPQFFHQQNEVNDVPTL